VGVGGLLIVDWGAFFLVVALLWGVEGAISGGMTRWLAGLLVACAVVAEAGVEWAELAPLPDAHGFAGAFAGEAGGVLVVAGGANFPGGAPWDGGQKVWHDRIFVLEEPRGEWREVGRLPRPLGYGASVSTKEGLVCVGGSDAERHHADVFRLRWTGESIAVDELVPLPVALADMAGVAVGGHIHVIGGKVVPDATEASARHLVFDGERWAEAEALPGGGRIYPVVGVRGAAFYVFSGAALRDDGEGGVVREYLRDAWRWGAGRGWERLADLPRAAVAAPSPAALAGVSSLLVVGGDDGELVGFEPRAAHPGFPREILGYEGVTDTWAVVGEVPEGIESPVTTPLVNWRGRMVIPTGESRPAVRTKQVVELRVVPTKAAFGAINWTIVGIYLAGMIGVGVFFMRRQAAATTEAYFRGGQRVPYWVAGLSIFATMLSALTFMGIPARAYQTDMSWYIGQLPILLIVPLVMACYLPFFRRLDLTSAYEYLERRFSLSCRLYASLSFTAFHLGRVAIVLYLPALALAQVSDIDVVTAVVVIGVLCVVYTVIGGIEAVVWTDAVQALVLMAGAVLCFVLAAGRIDGGLAGMAEIAMRDEKLFQSLRWDNFSLADGTTSVLVLFVAFFFNSLVPYTSSQDVVQRYVTTRDLAAAKSSLKVTMWMSVFGSMVFFLLGVAIYAFYQTYPDRLDPALPAADAILPFYIVRELPTGISGLVIAALFAAAQSTVSSSLNSVATTFVKDIDARLLRRGREDQAYLRSAQLAVVVAGLLGIGIAVVMASSTIESAFKTFNSMIGLTAGSLGGLFALGVFTRRSHGRGAFIGALCGLVTVLALHLGGAPVTGLLYAAIGFATCFFVGWGMSRLLPGRGDGSLSLFGER
jgi:solute:Na+ symporter, SSS family